MKVKIEGVRIHAAINTGASVNVMDLKTFSIIMRESHKEPIFNQPRSVFSHTENSRISPLGLICKNEFLDWAYSKGSLIEGGLFQSLAFSSQVDIKNKIIFSIIKNFKLLVTGSDIVKRVAKCCMKI